MFESDRGRPDPELRATRERSEPAVITIRTCFSYHPCRDGDGVSVSGEARVAGYHSEVIDFGEFTGQPPGYRGVGDVIQRMVREFGDDADCGAAGGGWLQGLWHQQKGSPSRPAIVRDAAARRDE